MVFICYNSVIITSKIDAKDLKMRGVLNEQTPHSQYPQRF